MFVHDPYQEHVFDLVWDSTTWSVMSKSVMLVFLGAGASVDAGLPTYQNSGGQSESILNRLTVLHTPERVWTFLEPLIRPVEPGPTYTALHRYLQSTGLSPDQILVVNQNVDGLASKALTGYRAIELHGNVHRSSCLDCAWIGATSSCTVALDRTRRCPLCESPCRPEIVLYRERPEQRHQTEIQNFIKICRNVVVIGTSLQLPYLKHWILLAKKRGAKIVHINNDPNYNRPYWEPRPYGCGGKYRSLVGKGERWLHLTNEEDLSMRPANGIEGLELLVGEKEEKEG